MQNDRDSFQLKDMDVFDTDGEKVGNVSAVEGDCLVVNKGVFFKTDYYIPTSAINTVKDEGVYLNVSKDEALNQGWDTNPTTSTDAESFSEEVAEARLDAITPSDPIIIIDD